MPKEVIKKTKKWEEDGTLHTKLSGRVVEVRWNKDGGHVQIVTADYSVKDMVFPNNHISQVVVGSESVPGWFVDLDRNEINRLIKMLRTARDQAYGRDE